MSGGLNSEKRDWPVGPRFKHWLPDGWKDKIDLPTDDPKTTLSVWFKRYGYVENNRIKFHEGRQEVDETVMCTQKSALFGGPLHGLVTVLDVQDEVIASLEKGKDQADLIDLAKKVAKLVYSSVSRFTDLLRL